MREVEKAGVLLDICPGCKGVWLDRGELEKLIQIADANEPGYGEKYIPKEKHDMPERGDSHSHHDDDDDRKSHDHDDKERESGDRGHDDRKDYDRGRGTKKRKGSWLSDILGAVGGGEGD